MRPLPCYFSVRKNEENRHFVVLLFNKKMEQNALQCSLLMSLVDHDSVVEDTFSNSFSEVLSVILSTHVYPMLFL